MENIPTSLIICLLILLVSGFIIFKILSSSGYERPLVEEAKRKIDSCRKKIEAVLPGNKEYKGKYPPDQNLFPYADCEITKVNSRTIEIVSEGRPHHLRVTDGYPSMNYTKENGMFK